MRVIYHCYGGTHSSVVAASIHVGKLPNDALPSASDLEGLPLFDKATRDDMGVVHRVGSDELGNEIFCLGRRNGALDVIGAIISISELSGEPSPLFVNTIPCVNTLMRVGGYLSREAGLTRIGRRLVVKGTLKAYWSLVNLVKQVKSQLRTTLSTCGDMACRHEPEKGSPAEDMGVNHGLEAMPCHGTTARNTTIYLAKAYSLLPVLAEGVRSECIKFGASAFKPGESISRCNGFTSCAGHDVFAGGISLPSCRNRFVSPELETLIRRWLESVKGGPGIARMSPDAWVYYVSKRTDVVSKAVRSWCALTGNGLIRLVDLGGVDQGAMPGLARVLALWFSGKHKGDRRFAIVEKRRNGIYMSFLNAQGRSVTSSIAWVFLTMAVKDTIRRRFAVLRDLVNETENGCGQAT
ncbi:MAG TPA: DUF3189 family protein [Clostridia bacterium]|nr:DUF3189 family protein [Clostridia bacterium]